MSVEPLPLSHLRIDVSPTPPRAPELHCPFASHIHPDADSIHLRSLAWAARVGLASSPAEERRLDAAKIGTLVARAHPSGALPALQIAADWTVLFCLLDDHLERLPSPSTVARTLARLSSALRHGTSGRANDPFERACLDLHARLAHMANPAARARFEAAVERLFEAFCVEAEARSKGRPPSLAAYLPMREVTVGIYVELALGEIVEGIELSEAARHKLSRLGLARAASNLIAWANDVYTYEKEIASGDPNNLVSVLAETEGLDLGRAVQTVVEMHDAEARAFDAVTAALAAVGCDAGLVRYAEMLRAWVRGHLDWGRETGRYRPAKPNVNR